MDNKLQPLEGGGQIRVHLLLLVSTSLVSTSFIVAKHITETLDPLGLTLVRFGLAALILLPIVALRHGLRVSMASLLRYGAVSGCLVIFFWAMFLSLRYTSSLNVSVIFTLVPAISGIYAAWFARERIGVNLLLVLSIGLIGALWVIFRGDVHLLREMSLNKGDLIFLGGCLAMGLYTPLLRVMYRNEPMEVMTFWILVTGCAWLLPGALVGLGRTNWMAVPVSTWLWILYLALFSTVITFYLTQYGTRVIGPTRTISYSYLYPLLVMILDFLLGKGWPELKVLPGVFLTLSAMLILLMPSFSRKRDKNQRGSSGASSG
jgi:drug/metabolite transporter (DMT)-like permease